MKKLLVSVLFALASSMSWAAPDMPKELQGQTVTIVIPYAAGGNADSWFRMLSKQIVTDTGLNLAIVNKPGAGSNIGTADVAKAKANGLTLLGTDSTSLVLNPLMKTPGAVDKNQFTAVTVNLVTAQGIYVAPNSKYNTLSDLIKDLQTNSKTINYGCSTAVCQISMAKLLDHFKIDMPMIRYNSTPQILGDVIGGTLTFAPTDPTGLAMARGGKVKPIAFSSEQKITGFSGVGLYKEVVPGLVVENFVGVWAPVGTPAHIVEYYNRVFKEAVQSVDTQLFVAQRGSRTLNLSVSATNEYVNKQIQYWKPLVDKYYKAEN